jgi:ribonuclease D
MPEFTLVDQPDTLASALREYDAVGVDTEFMREKTYFAELCLVQIATGDQIYCIDPLSDARARAFWDALLDTPWILHSGRQDIEVVFQTAGRMPDSIWDTQIAAGLLGYPPQMGYATLVKELFDVEIDKSHTRADWSRRPLSEAYLHYAAEDVEYLLPAHNLLAERLDKMDRLKWAAQDSALLLDTSLYDITPGSAIERLKGARNLRGKRRAAASRLAAWREAEALRANRPRQWIVRDAALMELATRLPARLDELDGIEGLSGRLIRRSGKNIIAAIAASNSDKETYSPPRPPDETQKTLLKSMQKKVAECAADLGLAAETIASKRDLSAVIIAGDRSSRVLTGWRRDLIGEQLLALL